LNFSLTGSWGHKGSCLYIVLNYLIYPLIVLFYLIVHYVSAIDGPLFPAKLSKCNGFASSVCSLRSLLCLFFIFSILTGQTMEFLTLLNLFVNLLKGCIWYLQVWVHLLYIAGWVFIAEIFYVYELYTYFCGQKYNLIVWRCLQRWYRKNWCILYHKSHHSQNSGRWCICPGFKHNNTSIQKPAHRDGSDAGEWVSK
jgi:hypothetical protein